MTRVYRKNIGLIFLSLLSVSIYSSDLFSQPQNKTESEAIRRLEEKAKDKETLQRPAQEYTAGNLKNPFQEPAIEEGRPVVPVQARDIPIPALTVQGVIWGGRFPQAIINNKVVKEGDVLDKVRILSIKKEGIIAIFEGRQFKLDSPAAGASVPAKSGGKQ